MHLYFPIPYPRTIILNVVKIDDMIEKMLLGEKAEEGEVLFE